MQTNRRKWIRLIGLGIAGIGITPLKTWASPVTGYFTDESSDEDTPIRLSSNENPYGPSPLARIAMAKSIDKSNRYQWATIADLITVISVKNKVAGENVLIGAGSMEILDIVVKSRFCTNGSFLVATPSYTGWTQSLEQSGVKKIAILLTADKRYNLKAMLAAIQPDTKFIYVCNPNNPTGTMADKETLISFIREATKKTMVIVDEAYLDFTNQASVAALSIDNENLVVVKTFSKIYGLAGARIGYAMAHKDTIYKISQCQSWANGGVSVVSRAGAMASLKDVDFVNQSYAKNEAVRKYTIDQLALLQISCIPSYTNFIYLSLANYKKDFFALLKKHHIQGTEIYEEEGRWTRITVGTMQEMQKFIAALQ